MASSHTAATRIWIIGPPGAGKTTLGRAISELTGAAHHQLDAELWGPRWQRRSEEDFLARVTRLAAEDRWVIDGQYTVAHQIMVGSAEIIVWLDLPERIWMPRLARRTVRDLVSRKALYNGNRQTVRGGFGLFGWAHRTRDEVVEINSALAARLPATVRLYRIRTPGEQMALLSDLQSASGPAQSSWRPRSGDS
jgi:shikimate kinase